MYIFLYKKIYSYFKLNKNFDPIFNSVCLVFIIQGVHFFLLMLILSRIFLLEMFKFSSVYSVNKLYFYPIGIVWLYLNFRYFKKKTDTITVEKTSKKELFLYLLFCLLIPLYFIIILSGGKIWKL
jgi:hypothetical protein